ncbi:MAG: peptide synthetase, partial [Verrucomicrobia bacterium]
ARVTVLSCVPTLLAMLDEDVPTLRLLILGGEACPQKLVERWAQPGRRMVNTYGPTETTVIATYAELSRGEPVTIGRAVPGYQVHLCDDGLRPVTNGDVGEIWIGGAGVARGYVGLPGSTEARFVPDPFAPDETDVRIYRTGDLGRFDHAGNIEFLGRADSQVKLRGFRVELSEIESVLMTGDGVLAAACAVCEDVPGVQQLVGYIVPSNGHVDEDRLRSLLRNRLPSYMVPAFFEIVRDLPRLPSGKLDRTALPAPLAREESSPSIANRPQTDLERRIETVWKKLFGPHPISLDHDFFLDLGGHSLLAARMVSELRKDPQFASVSMVDVYENPTIASLAGKFENAPHPAPHPIGWGEVGRRPGEGISARSAVTYFDEQSKSPSEVSPEPSPAPQEKSHDSNRRQHFAAGVLQSGGLYFVYGFRALHWVTPYLVYFFLLENNFSALASAAWAVTSAVAALPALMLVSIAIKWLVLGCIRAGRYPLWGAYYVRFWFVRNLIAALPLSHLCGTPLLAGFYRLLGARIGKDVHLETDQLVAYDLISIGDGTSIDDTAWLLGCAVENGELVIGPIQIGQNCFVGTRCVLREHTTMEDGARLDDLSLLSRGERIPHNESWAGSPARRGPGATSTTAPPRPRRSPLKSPLTIALYAALMLVIPALPLAAFVPGVALLMRIGFLEHPFLYLAAAPLVGALFVLLLTIGVVIFKKLLVGRVQPGTYPVHGSFYIRKWIVDQLLAISLDVVGSLHATLWLSPWYRALGAKLGKSVELSTATSATPDLLEIGDGGTVADEVSFGAAHIEGGWMTLAPTRLGQRAFVGNGAVLPPGTVIGDHSLVGVLSLAPTTRTTDAGQSGATWMGSPPILLPRRQASTPYPDAKTFCPTKRTRLARGAFELLRVTLPPAGFILVTTAVVTAALALWNGMGLWATILTLPIFYAASCAAVALGVAALKWLVMGRFRRFEYPLITPFVWRLELVNALYEFLITPLTLEALQGTPFLPWYYRLLGAKIGRRTYFHTTGLIEFDLVEVGDEAAVNEDCVLQTHLFEDRVLKAASLRVGRGCSMGAGSVVLYDSEMKAGSRLDALSLLMKGEVLPAGTSWAGSPARRRSDQHENVGANF